ncbi:MAG: hypothetical protein FJY95_17180 [Candidatus Handelsmanbacteria bacterium]|nr:hypothetical protein [Candidatus Handelsmanbacteria bacterium]
MDPFSSFSLRFRLVLPFLALWFAAGVGLAWWNPQPRLMLTVAVATSLGFLLLGPYAAAALYILRLQYICRGHLRWPLCLVPPLSTVLALAYLLGWPAQQAALAGATALLGTVMGHDATLAVLELKTTPGARLDRWMVLLFPLFIALAVLGGYCSLGVGSGSYRVLKALLG